MSRAVRIWELLVNKYPDHTELLNELGTAYCYNEREKPSKEKARITFEKVNAFLFLVKHLDTPLHFFQRTTPNGFS